MAVLEQIRTKGGWLILIIISIALLSFIIDPKSLQSVSNMFSSANDVGKINGESISAMEYGKKVEYYSEIDKILYNNPTQSDEMNERAKQSAWFSFLDKNLFEKEFKKIGLGVSTAEILDLAKGEHLSPIMQNLFTNPNTGKVNYAGIDAFWRNEQGDPTTQTLIAYFEDEIKKERKLEKYGQLMEKSNFVNNLQISNGVESRSNNVEFKYVQIPYPADKDSTIKISDSEIKKYYDENKNRFEQTESRDIDYVVFSILPSKEDFEKAKEKMEEITKEFAKTTAVREFAIANSEVAPSTKYYKKDELPADLGEFAFTASEKDVMPVYLDNYSYKTARISDVKNLPDSVKARQILIRYEQSQESYNQAKHRADSLYNYLKKEPSKFAEVAKTDGMDASATKGGDLGWIKEKTMVKPLVDSCFFNPAGKIMLVETQFGFHIVQVTELGKVTKKVQLATIEREVMPGENTLNSIYSSANNLVTGCEKNYDKFIKYIKDNGLEIQKESRIQRSARNIGNYDDARELVRWIYDAKLKDVSGIIELNNRNQLVVAAVTKIREDGYSPIEDEKQFIVSTLMLEKQHDSEAEKAKEKVQGATTIDEVAAKLGTNIQESVDGTNFGSNYISGIGSEPVLAAAVSSSAENKLYGPIEGNAGIYFYTVTGKKIDEGYTAELEKNRIKNTFGSKNFYNVLLKSAKIKDVRSKFF